MEKEIQNNIYRIKRVKDLENPYVVERRKLWFFWIYNGDNFPTWRKAQDLIDALSLTYEL